MSLSPKNLSSIQKAGQAVHDASVAISASVRTQAESMVASMSSAPFSAESEQVIVRFKSLSKLSHGLVAVEAQLQELYVIAADLASAVSDLTVVQSVAKRKSAKESAAVSVEEKPSKAEKKTKNVKDKVLALTSNDSKLLAFMQVALKSGAASAITGNALSAGSGLPLGSVGISLKKIIAIGAVKQVGRGTYQLGQKAVALAADPVVNSAPAKKAKLALAKKVKAVTAVKAEPVKKMKTAAAKKAKSGAASDVVGTPTAVDGAAPM